MSSHQLGSIIVTREEKPVGILTEWDMHGRVIALGRDPQKTRVDEVTSAPLPILELPKGVSCPYCGSTFENKIDLSKRIDRIHIGGGLLEGDLRRW